METVGLALLGRCDSLGSESAGDSAARVLLAARMRGTGFEPADPYGIAS